MIALPKNCPSCASELKWSKSGVDLMCANPLCDAKAGRSLVHFFSSIDIIDGFGPSTIEKLIENGVETIGDIYALMPDDFMMFGFGTKTSDNLFNELQQSLERELLDFKFIAGLGITNLGAGNAKKLLNRFSVEDILFDCDYNDFATTEGFGDIMASNIVDSLNANYDNILDIHNHEFNIVSSKIEVIQSCFTEKGVVFTGKMNSNREEMQNIATRLGAIVQNGVTKKTHYLVTGLNVGASKISKATRLGSIIITEEQFYNMAN